MMHTFHYRDGCYIHETIDERTHVQTVTWQDSRNLISSSECRSVRGAKQAITRHVNRMRR